MSSIPHALSSILMLCCSLMAAAAQEVRTAAAHDGGELRWDGVCYDYRDAEQRKAIKLWLPPGAEPVRGVILFGNPGQEGDTRGKALDPDWQDYAVQYRLGVAGVTWFPGRDVHRDTGRDILAAFTGFAAFDVHPELAWVPLIPRGSSNAGMTAYGLTCLVPERIACFTSNVGAVYQPETPPAAAMAVPAMLHIGPQDPFMPLGLKDTAELFARMRERAVPLWAWEAEEGKGHQEFNHLHMDLAFYGELLTRRLPAVDAPALDGPWSPPPVDPRSGLLADTDTWMPPWGSHRPCRVQPWSDQLAADPQMVWLPGPVSARAYQAAATWRRRAAISVGDEQAADPDGRWNIQGGSLRVIDPETAVELRIVPYRADDREPRPLPEWQRIVVYDNDVAVATIQAGADPVCRVVPDADRIEHVFTAEIHLADGDILTAGCASVVLRDPSLSAAVRAQTAVLEVHPPRPERPAGAEFGEAPVGTGGPDTLVAHALRPQQEATFAAASDRPSAFWADWPQASSTRIVPAEHGRGEARELTPDDAGLTVQAAYSRSGLYLLMQLQDDSPDPADATDFHLTRIPHRLLDEPGAELLTIRCDRNLLQGACQYRLDFGGSILHRNLPSPWHMDLDARSWDLDRSRTEDGIVVRQLQGPDGARLQEWFLPWAMVGSPAAWQQPPTGTRLAVALGLNDRDVDGSRASLRWPSGRDVWGGSDPRPDPAIYGSLLLAGPTP